MKTKRKFLSIALALTMAISAIPCAFALPSSATSGTTLVSYDFDAETDWVWSVPAAQIFADDDLSKVGAVAIAPAEEGGVIVLDAGTEISISMSSATYTAVEGFVLQDESGVSKIPYEITDGSDAIANGADVLVFTAGVSDNTGISQDLTFATTAENIKNATLTGEHTDTLTFTVAVDSGD